MTKPSKRNSLIVTIPLAAAAAAWVLFVFLPIQKAIGRLQNEMGEMQQYCDRAESLLPVLRRSGRELADLRTTIVSWREATPSHRNTSKLLGRITTSARLAGLRTTRFDPEPIVAHNRIAEMRFSMGLTGSFPHLYAFLNSLETMPETIWIDRLEIEKPGKDGNIVSCELNIVVFVDNPENSDQRNNSNNR
ncbi:MAG TPA: type 4a pilus biogenesis protein PilO [Thermoguttaceae bacterium]|nr:type 4a pilus biogenesis protein PilO [Thermoguttaceae bacterium]